jgi:hypothetical protein
MNELKPILIVPSGIISHEEKKSLSDAGYVVIVTDEPERIKIVTPSSVLDGVDMLNAAIIGLGETFSSDGRDKFFKEMMKQIRSKTH